MLACKSAVEITSEESTRSAEVCAAADAFSSARQPLSRSRSSSPKPSMLVGMTTTFRSSESVAWRGRGFAAAAPRGAGAPRVTNLSICARARYAPRRIRVTAAQAHVCATVCTTTSSRSGARGQWKGGGAPDCDVPAPLPLALVAARVLPTLKRTPRAWLRSRCLLGSTSQTPEDRAGAQEEGGSARCQA